MYRKLNYRTNNTIECNKRTNDKIPLIQLLYLRLFIVLPWTATSGCQPEVKMATTMCSRASRDSLRWPEVLTTPAILAEVGAGLNRKRLSAYLLLPVCSRECYNMKMKFRKTGKHQPLLV